MYKVKFVDQDGNKKTILIPEGQAWLSFGNFAGLGKFSKLKISQVPDQDNLVK
jgi:hypothetical protein